MAVEILLTGFEAFGGAETNISETIANRLDGITKLVRLADETGPMSAPERELEITIESHILSVDEAGSEKVSELLRGTLRTNPQVVVLLGMSSRSGSIRIEEVSYNEQNFSFPDNSGRKLVDSFISDSGHSVLHSTAPINLLKEELRQEENLTFSSDPGRFVCNETYFRTISAVEELGLRERHGRALPVIFVHIDESGIDVDEASEQILRIAAICAQRPQMQVVGGMLRDGGGRLHAARRAEGEYMAGYWEFPGGKVERGESRREALIREYKEEFSWDITPLHICEEYSHAWPEMEVHLTFFHCQYDGELPPAVMTSHDESRWLAEEELISVDWLPPDVKFIERLIEKGVANL